MSTNSRDLVVAAASKTGGREQRNAGGCAWTESRYFFYNSEGICPKGTMIDTSSCCPPLPTAGVCACGSREQLLMMHQPHYSCWIFIIKKLEVQYSSQLSLRPRGLGV